MDTINEAIKRAVARAGMMRPIPRDVPADEVARTIDRLSERGYVCDAQHVAVIIAYLQGFGLLLTGAAGAGKTYFVRSLGVHLVTAEYIAMAFGIEGVEEFNGYYDGREICIDDLGAEPVARNFGAVDDVLRRIIAHRCERQKGRTHITTNMESGEVLARYGDRTMSRILGMCQPFRIDGGNRRAAVPTGGHGAGGVMKDMDAERTSK
jgi:hypothetical protein